MRVFARPLSVEEFERLPGPFGEGKVELVDGRVVEMAPVGGVHGIVQLELGARLREHVRANGGRRLGRTCVEVLYHVAPAPPHARGPDASFISAARHPGPLPRGVVRAVPELAAEVLSPEDDAEDVAAKVALYLAAGVLLVWVLDPETRTVAVHRPGQEAQRLGPDGALSGERVLPGFRLPLAELWAELDPAPEA